MLPIINDWIEKGSIIVSDFFKSYDCLSRDGYKHIKVNHSLHFKVRFRRKKFLPLRRQPGMSTGTTAAASLRSPLASLAATVAKHGHRVAKTMPGLPSEQHKNSFSYAVRIFSVL